MQKNLIAAAVAVALAAPATAFADATMYGKIHMSLDSLDDGNESGTFLSSNSSRLGFMGKEDLGNGLTVLYQLEGEILWDGESKAFGASRNSFVGLKGDWGQFLGGIHDTPMKKLRIDYFDEQVGDVGNITRQKSGGSRGWDECMTNILIYTTPVMNGVQGQLAYALGEDLADDKDVWSGSVKYKTGGLSLGIGYESHTDDTEAQDEESIVRATGEYKVGAFSVAGLWQQVSDGGFVAGADRNAWGVSGAYSAGNARFKLQHYVADDVDGVEDSVGSMTAIGVDYKLSKRTTTYVVYGVSDNDSGASFVPYKEGRGEAPAISAPGEDASGLSLGIIHKF